MFSALMILLLSFSLSHGQTVQDADLNGSGQVDFPDFLAFATSFGSSTTDGANPDADFNGDGEVGFADFLFFASVFGQDTEFTFRIAEDQGDITPYSIVRLHIPTRFSQTDSTFSAMLGDSQVEMTRYDDSTLVFVVPAVEAGSHQLSATIGGVGGSADITVQDGPLIADVDGYLESLFARSGSVLDSLSSASPGSAGVSAWEQASAALAEASPEVKEQLANLFAANSSLLGIDLPKVAATKQSTGDEGLSADDDLQQIKEKLIAWAAFTLALGVIIALSASTSWTGIGAVVAIAALAAAGGEFLKAAAEFEEVTGKSLINTYSSFEAVLEEIDPNRPKLGLAQTDGDRIVFESGQERVFRIQGDYRRFMPDDVSSENPGIRETALLIEKVRRGFGRINSLIPESFRTSISEASAPQEPETRSVDVDYVSIHVDEPNFSVNLRRISNYEVGVTISSRVVLGNDFSPTQLADIDFTGSIDYVNPGTVETTTPFDASISPIALLPRYSLHDNSSYTEDRIQAVKNLGTRPHGVTGLYLTPFPSTVDPDWQIPAERYDLLERLAFVLEGIRIVNPSRDTTYASPLEFKSLRQCGSLEIGEDGVWGRRGDAPIETLSFPRLASIGPSVDYRTDLPDLAYGGHLEIWQAANVLDLSALQTITGDLTTGPDADLTGVNLSNLKEIVAFDGQHVAGYPRREGNLKVTAGTGSLDLPSLESVAGDIRIVGTGPRGGPIEMLNSITMPALESHEGKIEIRGADTHSPTLRLNRSHAMAEHIGLDNLRDVGTLKIIGADVVHLDLSSLRTADVLVISDCPYIESIDLSSLDTVSEFLTIENQGARHLSLPKLQRAGFVQISGSKLETVDLSNLMETTVKGLVGGPMLKSVSVDTQHVRVPKGLTGN